MDFDQQCLLQQTGWVPKPIEKIILDNHSRCKFGLFDQDRMKTNLMNFQDFKTVLCSAFIKLYKPSKNYPKIIQKLFKNYPKTIQNYPKTIQKLSKPIQKPSKNNPKNVQNYPKTIQKQTN